MQKGIFKIKRTVSLKVDDPVDAVAVHFARGLVGMIASPIFMNNGIYVYFLRNSFMSILPLLVELVSVV